MFVLAFSCRQDVAFFDANKTGQLVNRLTADIQEFKSSFKLVVSQVSADVPAPQNPHAQDYCRFLRSWSNLSSVRKPLEIYGISVLIECVGGFFLFFSFLHKPNKHGDLRI